jgi:hypothetical protein
VNAGSRQCSRAIPSIPFAGRGDETSSAEDEFPASSISEDSLHHLRSLMPDCCNRRTLSAAIPGCPAGAAAGERELKRLPNERVSWPGLGGAHRVDKFAGHQEKPGWRSHCFAARDRPAVADPVSPGDDPPGIFARPFGPGEFRTSHVWLDNLLLPYHSTDSLPAPLSLSLFLFLSALLANVRVNTRTCATCAADGTFAPPRDRGHRRKGKGGGFIRCAPTMETRSNATRGV